MKEIPGTPLDPWIRARTGIGPEFPLNRETLESYQLEKLRETITHARRHSLFYRALFSGLPEEPVASMGDLAGIPFTVGRDIRQDPLRFLCVSHSHVARAVTLHTSGSTGPPKRLFFTGSDLELTIDFFHHGMSGLVSPGQKVLILLPGTTPGSVGDLLVRGLGRMNVQGIVHGPVHDPAVTLREMARSGADSLVGIPVQVLSLVRHPNAGIIAPGRIRSVLLSTDYVPEAIVSDIKGAWGTRVFQHYGMTETGLGGGVECAACSGYHLREADLLYEIIDPETGEPVAHGQTGEVVVTTLTRRAMPLVRYRTGDMASLMPGPCPCGSHLMRMAKVTGRSGNEKTVGNGVRIILGVLDEAVFAVPWVLDYRVEIFRVKGNDHLSFLVQTVPGHEPGLAAQVRRALAAMPEIDDALHTGQVTMEIHCRPLALLPRDRPAKRQILDRRGLRIT